MGGWVGACGRVSGLVGGWLGRSVGEWVVGVVGELVGGCSSVYCCGLAQLRCNS